MEERKGAPGVWDTGWEGSGGGSGNAVEAPGISGSIHLSPLVPVKGTNSRQLLVIPFFGSPVAAEENATPQGCAGCHARKQKKDTSTLKRRMVGWGRQENPQRRTAAKPTPAMQCQRKPHLREARELLHHVFIPRLVQANYSAEEVASLPPGDGTVRYGTARDGTAGEKEAPVRARVLCGRVG